MICQKIISDTIKVNPRIFEVQQNWIITTMQFHPPESEICFCTDSNNFACQGLWWCKHLGTAPTRNNTYNNFTNQSLHETNHYWHETEGSCYQPEIAFYLAIDMPVVLNSRPMAL